ncbi:MULTISPECIES: nucleotidyltransferase domain-containing protein [unclassified Brevibacterium]|uniref:nucleotidyltransferase family protein n=1 Tax=unclassified Brevibacterium TaxID=2614124 RepID=UPI0020177089|nr:MULTISPECIES: nucleotidyltransferase domain-containing protein [unclassified Brevibacterium]MCM1011205.1 nucleotidyltransferase domain-containing protein [Brevibacterium sp. XM4083]
MSTNAVTPESLALRELIDVKRQEFEQLLTKFSATNPRLFGSVARGTAVEGSDIDILVDMDPADGNLLMRIWAHGGDPHTVGSRRHRRLSRSAAQALGFENGH